MAPLKMTGRKITVAFEPHPMDPEPDSPSGGFDGLPLPKPETDSTVPLADRMAKPPRGKVTAWAGMDPACDLCKAPATWLARNRPGGVVVAAACKDHKAEVRQGLIDSLQDAGL